MARANIILVEKLREAASNLEGGGKYSWGHVSQCNCGHLAQCITPLKSEDIYRRAAASQLSEWSEYANDYCPVSEAPIDFVIDAMFQVGMEQKDLHQLEYLSNICVLKALPGGFRYLRKGNRGDAALYMRTWAGLLELELKSSESKKSAERVRTVLAQFSKEKATVSLETVARKLD